MTDRSLARFIALCLIGSPGLGFGNTLIAAPYGSSLSPARLAAQRRAFAGATGGYGANARAAQQRTNYIGKSQIPVATQPSAQIPVATKPQMQIPYQRTPAPSVVTPPLIKTPIYQPATLAGFYPVMQKGQAVNPQARSNGLRMPSYNRVNLHPERAWQNADKGTAMAFRRRIR